VRSVTGRRIPKSFGLSHLLPVEPHATTFDNVLRPLAIDPAVKDSQREGPRAPAGVTMSTSLVTGSPRERSKW
jgi:hypothetical protein